MVVVGEHDPLLVALSIVIAATASFTALDLAARVRATTGWGRSIWIATAAVAMGGGIWSMHFVAMLAFEMPMPMSYDAGLTGLSLLLAIVFTGAGFSIVSRLPAGAAALASSGLLMGLGISAMHYTGMAAMRMPHDVSYAPGLVALSVVIAVCASTVALWIAFQTTGAVEKLVAAAAMGLAISGMHYTGMAAAIFTAHATVLYAPALTALNPATLAIAIAATTFLILFLALIGAMFDRRFAHLADREAQALRHSEEQFRLLYRKTPLPLFSLAADGRIEQVSDAWLELLGFAREAVVGRPLTDFMTPESASRLDEEWPRLLDSGALHSPDYRLVGAADQTVDADLSLSVQRGEDGRFSRVLCGVVDVTAHRRAEEALRQAQKLEIIGRLTGGVAHDFNNVLAIVLGSLEPLRKRMTDDPRTAPLLDSAIEGAKRGKALIERMLAFARRQDLKPTAIDLAELVWGMAELLRRSIGPSLRIDTQFPMDMPPALVDANQLELALANLAINARDAMPDGGRIVIGARVATVTSADEGLPPGDYLRLYVRDEGEGMDAATLARATEPFFTTKGVGKGTGLGLSMVDGLAAQSGGRLVLTSRQGEGTTAEMWLPVAAASAAADTAKPAESEPAVSPGGRPLTVLLVDDEFLVVMGTQAMLEDLGHTVLTAGSGEEALQTLRHRGDVDLVITDQAMPAMSGVQLAAAIEAEWPGLPVILVTGYADLSADIPPTVPKLTKPVDQATLSQAIAARIAAREAAAKVVRLHAL